VGDRHRSVIVKFSNIEGNLSRRKSAQLTCGHSRNICTSEGVRGRATIRQTLFHLSDRRSPFAFLKLQARERTSDLVFARDEGRQLVRDAALAHGVLVLPVHAQFLQKHDRAAHNTWRVSGFGAFWSLFRELTAALELGQALRTARGGRRNVLDEGKEKGQGISRQELIIQT
jgi:hypothetical protein